MENELINKTDAELEALKKEYTAKINRCNCLEILNEKGYTSKIFDIIPPCEVEQFEELLKGLEELIRFYTEDFQQIMCVSTSTGEAIYYTNPYTLVQTYPKKDNAENEKTIYQKAFEDTEHKPKEIR
jgi:hypothetical protein